MINEFSVIEELGENLFHEIFESLDLCFLSSEMDASEASNIARVTRDAFVIAMEQHFEFRGETDAPLSAQFPHSHPLFSIEARIAGDYHVR